jgi:carboxylesterase
MPEATERISPLMTCRVDPCRIAANGLLVLVLVSVLAAQTSCRSLEETGGAQHGPGAGAAESATGSEGAAQPKIREIFFKGGRDGILLIHGYATSSLAFLEMAKEFNQHGYTVYSALLPGHGTTVEDLDTVTREDYYRYVEEKLQEFSGKVDRVFVVGHSLGALLTVRLAARHENIEAIALMSAPVANLEDKLGEESLQHLLEAMVAVADKIPRPNPRYLVEGDFFKKHGVYKRYSAKGIEVLLEVIEETGKLIEKVDTPAIVVQGKHDLLVHSSSARYIYDTIKSERKDLLYVDTITHRIYISREMPSIVDAITQFFKSEEGCGEHRSGG